jgi:hypothetical protein
MDRAGRILAVWIVGCMIPGTALLGAHAPLFGLDWTTNQEFWFRIALLLSGLAVGGVVAEIALVLWSFRRKPALAAAAEAAPRPIDPQSPEVTAARSRLAELEAKEDREQRRGRASAYRDRANHARGIRSDHEKPSETHFGRLGAAHSWARANGWNSETAWLLQRDEPDHPEYFDYFERPMDPLATADPDWRTNLATYLETKATRLEWIADRVGNY